MTKIKNIEKEFIKALNAYPQCAELYNDYAMFLYRYKNDYNTAVKFLLKALKLNPENKIYRYNYNKIVKNVEIKFTAYHNFLVLLIVGIMVWLGYNGYNNLMNMTTLFLAAQIIMNYQKNIFRKEKSIL